MKTTFTFLFTITISAVVFAQAPNKISYQAVVRNSNGELIKSSNVGIRISIIQGSSNIVYKETQTVATNNNGLLTIEIGGGTAVTGTFAGINWANSPYFIKTEIDPAGGTYYSITTSSQLLSVPYALYAGSCGNSPNTNPNIIPRTAARGQLLSVSFSGGDNVSFTQASPSGRTTRVRYPFNTTITSCSRANFRATPRRSLCTSAIEHPASRAISPGWGVITRVRPLPLSSAVCPSNAFRPSASITVGTWHFFTKARTSSDVWG